MNKLLFVFLIAITFVSCNPTKSKESNNNGQAELAIQQEIHNFGTLEAGEIVSYSFYISNSGEGLLKIDSVAYGCGCITVTWPEKGLKHGESGFVKVTYDSGGEWGNIYQTLEIFSNAPEKKKIVYIAAKVNNQLFNQE